MSVDVNEFNAFAELLPDARYVVLQPNRKQPVGSGGERVYTDAVGARSALAEGKNVGLMASDDVFIIDVDDPDVLPDELFTQTLSVRSRKRIGTHYFYTCADDRVDALRSISGICDVQLYDRNSYVVAPGSFVPCDDELIAAMPGDQKPDAGKYSIARAIPPTTISYDEIPQHIKWYAHCARAPEAPTKTHPPSTGGRNALYDLTVRDVVRVNSEGGFKNPFHGAKTGYNSKMVGGKLMCYKCQVSHTGFTALAVLAGVATCQSAGYNFGDKHSSVDRYDGEALNTMWFYALRNGILPITCIPPARAVAHYAIKNEFVDTLVDGWKVPTDVYSDVINAMRMEV